MKFAVLKVEDVLKVCNENQLATLDVIARMIGEMRKEEGRNPNPQYLVINKDEPYVDKIKAIIEEHEREEVIFD
jgi:regulator of PEP synthase PpsR (kinase-PPPase family)